LKIGEPIDVMTSLETEIDLIIGLLAPISRSERRM